MHAVFFAAEGTHNMCMYGIPSKHFLRPTGIRRYMLLKIHHAAHWLLGHRPREQGPVWIGSRGVCYDEDISVVSLDDEGLAAIWPVQMFIVSFFTTAWRQH